MAKKDKAKKGEKPEGADAATPEAEGGEGAPPAQKKMAGKTLVLFIILPAVLVLGGGGAAAFMLLGGKPAEAEAHGEVRPGGHAEKKPEKKPAKKDDHGGGGDSTSAAAAGDELEMGRLLDCEEGNPCYYAMPDLIVNLAAVEGQREQSLKLDLVLESSDPRNFDAVPAAMPRIKDQLNSFLRELRVEDLNGSAGTYRLRRELMKRFNLVIAPAKVDAVLIEGMLIQ